MIAAAADDDRWKTDLVAAVAVVRAATSSAPSIVVDSCARFVARPSDPAPKGSTRLSSN